MANLIDKYNDMIESGKSEDDAVNITVGGIGDVDELLRGLKEQDVFNYEKMQNDRKKSALILSISVAMYIMSIVVVIIFDEIFSNDTIGVCLMFTIDAVATALIVYNFMSRPKYRKEDDTMVEEFKEWKSDKSNKKQILNSIRSIVWTIIVAIYLIISFAFGIWSFSWIIFIIGLAVERIITLFFQLKE